MAEQSKAATEAKNEAAPANPGSVMRYFSYDHLPENELREVSKAVADVAFELDKKLPSGAEKSAGMRKLLEAKDCFVRAAL